MESIINLGRGEMNLILVVADPTWLTGGWSMGVLSYAFVGGARDAVPNNDGG
jgi:hypothetical protein